MITFITFLHALMIGMLVAFNPLFGALALGEKILAIIFVGTLNGVLLVLYRSYIENEILVEVAEFYENMESAARNNWNDNERNFK